MRSMLSGLSTRLKAKPFLPKRPVRPIRWRYVSLSAFPSLSTGRSKLTTMDTCSTSIPGEPAQISEHILRHFNQFLERLQSRLKHRLPLEQTLVVTSTFSLPSLKRWMTEALCSTIISPLSKATWWPSLDSCPLSQAAILRVWKGMIFSFCFNTEHGWIWRLPLLIGVGKGVLEVRACYGNFMKMLG